MTHEQEQTDYVPAGKRLFPVAASALVIGGMIAAFTTPNLDPETARQQALTEFRAGTPLGEVAVDRLVRARVDLGDQPAHLEQLHLSRGGQPEAVSIRVGTTSEWLTALSESRRMTVSADQIRFNRETGRMVVNPDALRDDASDDRPRGLDPQPIANIAASRMVGAEIVDRNGHEIGYVAEVAYDDHGSTLGVRLMREDFWGRTDPAATRVLPAECVGYVALTRTIVAAECEPVEETGDTPQPLAQTASADTACIRPTGDDQDANAPLAG